MTPSKDSESYARALRSPETELAWYRIHRPKDYNKLSHLRDLKRANRARWRREIGVQ